MNYIIRHPSQIEIVDSGIIFIYPKALLRLAVKSNSIELYQGAVKLHDFAYDQVTLCTDRSKYPSSGSTYASVTLLWQAIVDGNYLYPADISVYKVWSAASNNAAVIKSTPGVVVGYYLFNTASSIRYVKLYDKATTPTPASDTSYVMLPVPASSGANLMLSDGIPFLSGIGIAITGGAGANDNTSVSANDVVVNIYYR